VPLVAAIPVFYRCCVSRSPYRTISWSSTWSQLRYLCVHFFVTFLLARNSIFSNGVSLGNTLFVLVAFRYWRLSPPIMSVVYITRRMPSGNWKGELTSSQLPSQLLIAYGYFLPMFLPRFPVLQGLLPHLGHCNLP
jgi:hypothetical protein